MLRFRGISQRMKGLTIDRIIPLFAIVSLDHDRYPGVKISYLTVDTTPVDCNLLQLSGLLSSKETRQRSLGIPNVPLSNTIANCVSNTPNNPPQNERPAHQPPKPPTQSSRVAYPPARGVPWKFIVAMMQEDKSCLGCHFNHPDNSPRLKFHQDVGCPALAKHGYIYWKDVTASAKVVDRFNNKFSNMKDQSRKIKPVAKRVSDNSSSDQVYDRRFHPPSISKSTLDSTATPYPIANTLLLMPNRVAPIPASNGYNNLYSLYSDDDPVFGK